MTEETRKQTTPSPPPGDPSPWALAGLGMQFFVALLAFVYAGNWMDARFGTSPICLFVGVFVGGGGTFYLSYQRLMRKGTVNDTRTPDSSDRANRP